MIGQIANLTINDKQMKSHLEIEINKFVKFLTIFAIIVSIIVCIIGFMQGKDNEITLILTSFIVCAISLVIKLFIYIIINIIY